MKRNESQRNASRGERGSTNTENSSTNTGAQVSSHAPMFVKVLDGRKQPVRGLWQRGSRFYAQLSIEDFANGKKRVRRVPLVNSEAKPVETVAQAIAELNRLRTQRSDDALPQLGRTPTFSAYADAYLAGIKTGVGTKKPNTIAKEEHTLALWKNHLGGIRLDKIRPAHVAGFMKKRLADDMSKRTVKLDVIALRNVLKQARDVDQHITELPVPPGINRELKSVAPTRELFTPAELETLCAAAMGKKPDGSPVTKNGQQFTDYVRLMGFCGARRNEALALRWADVHFDTGYICQKCHESGSGITLVHCPSCKSDEIETTGYITIGSDGDTKNSTSRRVDFNPALKNHLLAMKSRRAPDSQWLFPSPQRGEKDIHAMSFRESLELARAHAKLRRVGFHDLRHLFISFCVMSGIDFMTIAKWVGHRDGGILIGKVYGHLADAHTKEAALRVNFGPAIVDIGIYRERGTGRRIVQLWSKDSTLPGAITLRRQQWARTRAEAIHIRAAWMTEVSSERIAFEKAVAAKPVDPFPPCPDNCAPASATNREETERARKQSVRHLFPRTYAAFDAKANAQAVTDAYLIDTAELHGEAHADIRRSDPILDIEIAAAIERNRKQKTKRGWAELDHLFSLLWPRMIYLSSKDGADMFKVLTNIPMTAKQFKNRRDKLKLETRRPPGPDRK